MNSMTTAQPAEIVGTDDHGDVHVLEVDGEEVEQPLDEEHFVVDTDDAPVEDHIVLDTQDDHHEDDPTAYHVTVDDLCPTTSMYEDWT